MRRAHAPVVSEGPLNAERRLRFRAMTSVGSAGPWLFFADPSSASAEVGRRVEGPGSSRPQTDGTQHWASGSGIVRVDPATSRERTPSSRSGQTLQGSSSVGVAARSHWAGVDLGRTAPLTVAPTRVRGSLGSPSAAAHRRRGIRRYAAAHRRGDCRRGLGTPHSHRRGLHEAWDASRRRAPTWDQTRPGTSRCRTDGSDEPGDASLTATHRDIRRGSGDASLPRTDGDQTRPGDASGGARKTNPRDSLCRLSR